MQDETYASLFTNRTQLAVARIMPVPFAAAIAATISMDDAPFSMERRWQRDNTGPFDRSDLAPARTCGHLNTGRRAVSVEVELAPWAGGVTELVLRPNVRAPHRWSGRRRRTWYASAHAAADALRQRILDAQPATHRERMQAPIVARRRLAG
jgi:hypothetical protein